MYPTPLLLPAPGGLCENCKFAVPILLLGEVVVAGGPSSGNSQRKAVGSRRISKAALAVIVVLIVVCAAVGTVLGVLFFTANSKITVSVTNISNEGLRFVLYKGEAAVKGQQLPGGSTWGETYTVMSGEHNFTVRYNYTRGEALETSTLVRIGVISKANVYFNLTNPHPIITPSATLWKSSLSDGKKIQFLTTNMTFSWDNTSLVLRSGANSASWQPTSAGLTAQASATSALGSHAVGIATVWCNASDLLGNGLVNPGDFFTFRWSTMYPLTNPCTVSVVFEPSGLEIASISFAL